MDADTLNQFKLAIRQLFTAVQMRQWDMVESATNVLHTLHLGAENAASGIVQEEPKAEAEEAEAPAKRRR